MNKKVDVDRKHLYFLYYNKFLSQKQIAKKLGISQTHVGRLMKRFSIPQRTNSEGKLKGKRKPTKEEIYNLYWKQGLSTVDIAKKFGVHNKTIGTWMKQYNIKARPLYKGSSKLRLIPDEEIVKLYKKLGGYMAVAKELGGRPENVRNILNKYVNLKRPDDWAVKVDTTPSLDMSYVLGVMLGDGSITNNSIGFIVADLPFAESFLGALKRLGFNANMSDKVKRLKPHHGERHHVWASSKNFAKWYKEMSLKDIYDFISESREMKLEFVRGFHESEGCHSARNAVSISNSNKAILDMVERILKSFGIYSYIGSPYYSKKHPEWKGMYQLNILRKESIFHFFCNIHPVIKFRKDLWEEIAREKIEKSVEAYKRKVGFHEHVIYKFLSKAEMNELLKNHSPAINEMFKLEEEVKVPMASSNRPFILYICLDYIRELTKFTDSAKRNTFIDGMVIHELEHGKINDSFTDKMEEERFIVEKTRKEYPKLRKAVDELLPRHI